MCYGGKVNQEEGMKYTGAVDILGRVTREGPTEKVIF